MPTQKPTADKLWPQDDPSVIQDVSYTEGDYKSNLKLPGLTASLEAGFESGFTYKTFEKLDDSLHDKNLPNNKFLTPEQAKESPDYRPGIDVSNGISQYMLQRASQTYDRRQEQQFAMSQMPDGIGSAIGRGAIGFIGTSLDPATLAVSVLAPETIGVRGAAFIAAASNPLVRGGLRIGTGITEGAAIGTPGVVSDLMDENKYIPEDGKGAHAIADLASYMAFGGVIRGITGVKLPITKEAAQYANQVSVHQIAEGFFPNTDLIVKQGYFEARQIPEQEAPIKKITTDFEQGLTDDEKADIENSVLTSYSKIAGKRIKNSDVKKTLGSIYKLRAQRNKISSDDYRQQLYKEVSEKHRHMKPANKNKIVDKQIKIEKAPLDKEIGKLEKSISNNEEYKEANAKLQHFKQKLLGNEIDQKIAQLASDLLKSKPKIDEVFEGKKEADTVIKTPYGILADESLKGSINDIDKNLNDLQKYLPQDLIQDKTNKNTSQIISEVLDDQENLPDQLNGSSQKYSQLQLPSYLRRAIETMRKRPEYRTAEETKQLLSTLFEDENKLIKRDSRNVSNQLKGNITDTERLYLENEAKNLKARQADLTKAQKKYGDLWRTKQAFDASLLKKYDILQTLKRNEVYKLMLKDTGSPVNKSELQDAMDASLSPANELPINANEDAIFKQSIASIPENFDEAYDNALQTFNSIDSEITKSAKEEMNLIQQAANVVTKALEKAAKCLGGVQ